MSKASVDYRDELVKTLRGNEEAGLSRESLYRILSADGNLKLDTVFKMVHALGLKLTVEPIEKKVS